MERRAQFHAWFSLVLNIGLKELTLTMGMEIFYHAVFIRLNSQDASYASGIVFQTVAYSSHARKK